MLDKSGFKKNQLFPSKSQGRLGAKGRGVKIEGPQKNKTQVPAKKPSAYSSEASNRPLQETDDDMDIDYVICDVRNVSSR